ncbi:MAG TPA: Hsp20/alpha crystallin family protein [Bacteroidia bacterium]|nr:Hsp20/alpha crystallin family protein [Bacteroidia bacterium]
MATMLKPKENFSSLGELFDVDRFFGNPWFREVISKAFPAVNIRETAKDYSIEFAVPGFKKEDFKIRVEKDVLIVSADEKEEKKEDKETYTRREFSFHSFSRSFILPESAERENIEAKYENGILKIVVSKKQSAPVPAKKEIQVS